MKDVKSKRIDICIALAMAVYGMTQIYIPEPQKEEYILHNEGAGILWVERLDGKERPFNWPHPVPVN